MTLAIVGMPASGKSTVGRLVAQRLGWRYVDTDEQIEQSTGKLIREIFADDGEDAFRELEAQAVADALAGGGVVSLGGGAVVTASVRDALREHTVVWLETSVTSATRRAGMTALRPLLLGDVRERMQALLDERIPLYTSVATHTVTTDRRTAAEVADEIVALATVEAS